MVARIVGVAGFVSLVLAGILFAGEGPGLVTSEHGNQKSSVWVPATSAVSHEGTLETSVFEEIQRKSLESNRGLAYDPAVPPIGEVSTGLHLLEGPCLILTYSSVFSFPGRDSTGPADLLDSGTLILSGVSAEPIQGFFHGAPGSLVPIRITEVFRQAEEKKLEPGDVVFLVWPRANFRIHDEFFCNQTEAAIEVGSRVLVSSVLAPLGEDSALVLARHGDVLVQDPTGKVRAPLGWKAPSKSGRDVFYDNVLDEIRTIARCENP